MQVVGELRERGRTHPDLTAHGSGRLQVGCLQDFPSASGQDGDPGRGREIAVQAEGGQAGVQVQLSGQGAAVPVRAQGEGVQHQARSGEAEVGL